ncbi:MAG: hypothetical protein ACK45E_09395, partial [Ignavibacteria bacterium]
MRFRSLAVILIVLLLQAGTIALHAQTQPRSPIIAGITVEGLTQGADMQTVIAYSGLRVGQEAKPDDLMTAVKNLWNRRTFNDVKIEKER